MTAEEVRAKAEEIRACRSDNEAAHKLEDELRRAVLAAIADGADNAAELAREALKTREIKFVRWYS